MMLLSYVHASPQTTNRKFNCKSKDIVEQKREGDIYNVSNFILIAVSKNIFKFLHDICVKGWVEKWFLQWQ